jgi:DNA-binding Lrp family transcriptional regulator
MPAPINPAQPGASASLSASGNAAGSLERMRAGNRRALIAVLVGEGATSRAQLARTTGLSRTTVSNLVRELIESGQVVETADRGTPHKGGSGRPPVLVTLATRSGAVAGIDVGHRHVRVAVADRTGRVLEEETSSLDVDGQGERTLARAAAMVDELFRRSGAERLHGVGMCVPAPIDRRSARISSGILPGWRDLVPTEVLERELGVPVTADNDANLGALAELHHGAARGVSDLVYLKIASGLGAGIVLGGRLHRGTQARSVMCRSARTVRSAGAATGVVSRPRWRCPSCWRCCSRRTTSRWTRRGCWSSTPRAMPAYAGSSATPARPWGGRSPTCATASTPSSW